MTLGIGLYGPCMILVSLLGMNPDGGFPDHDGFLRISDAGGQPAILPPRQSFSLRASLGLALGGIPAVLIAAFIVKALPLTAVRWLVIVVVVYAAIAMLRSAREGTPLIRAANAIRIALECDLDPDPLGDFFLWKNAAAIDHPIR